MIRLSTAHAKARLSKTVDLEDAQAAIELVQFAYFKKVKMLTFYIHLCLRKIHTFTYRGKDEDRSLLGIEH